MADHSSTLAWRILWAEEPGRLQSFGLQRVGHDWATNTRLFYNQIQLIYSSLCLKVNLNLHFLLPRMINFFFFNELGYAAFNSNIIVNSYYPKRVHGDKTVAFFVFMSVHIKENRQNHNCLFYIQRNKSYLSWKVVGKLFLSGVIVFLGIAFDTYINL